MPQAPALHDGVALAAAHGWLHPPQLLTSLARFTSQPLACTPSQSANPFWQTVKPQTLAAQVPKALANTQAAPQAPQFAASPVSATSHPSVASWLQSA